MLRQTDRTNPSPLASSYNPFALVAAVAIVGLAWWTSDRPPSGCYRMTGESYLAVADGKVRLFVSGREESHTTIVETDRIRGYVLTLNRELSPAPAEIPSNARTLVIFEDGRDRPHAVMKSAVAASPRFYEIRCKPSASDPQR